MAPHCLHIKMVFNMLFVSLVWPWPTSSDSFPVFCIPLYASKRSSLQFLPTWHTISVTFPSAWNNSPFFWLTSTRLSSGGVVGKMKNLESGPDAGNTRENWGTGWGLERGTSHPISTGQVHLFPRTALKNSHKFGSFNNIWIILQICKCCFTELKSKFLQATFLSKGSKGESISCSFKLLAEYYSLWLEDYDPHFMRKSDEGPSQVLEATHVPWLVSLLPHSKPAMVPQFWSLLLPSHLSVLPPPTSSFWFEEFMWLDWSTWTIQENLSVLRSLTLIISVSPFATGGNMFTGPGRPFFSLPH